MTVSTTQLEQPSIQLSSEKRMISKEELGEHSKADDCWISVNGVVYDITKWWKSHPGGNVILSHAGNNATDVFDAFHKGDEATRRMKNLKQVGLLVEDKPSELVREFREMKAQLKKEGYFDANPTYFWLVLASIIALHIVGVGLIHYDTSMFSILLSSLIVGIAWGQLGFLQHDFGHKSVFGSIQLNEIGHMLTYGCWLGGIPEWWNGRHNRHHAIPNHSKWDLDIRTLPLFAWNKRMAKQAPASLVRYQSLYWFVVGPATLMLFYKVLNTIYMFKRAQKYILPNIIHHTFVYMCAGHLGFGYMLLWYILNILNMGNYLGWMFALNHYMLPIHESRDNDWVTATAISTQNVDSGLFIEWFSGGLCYQVEHHLFPTMPRSSYAKVHDRILQFFKKHGLTFHHSDIATAAIDVVKTLDAAVQIEMKN